ncbi:MAG: hypothetical protein ACOYXC_06175 [Candidatus Rifleibacteriota bacterium]
MKFAIARLKVSKGDLYSLALEKEFLTLVEAMDCFEKEYANKPTEGSWQDHVEYKVIEVRDGRYFWPGDGEIDLVC